MAVLTSITLFFRILSSNTFDIVFALAIAAWVSIACVFIDMIGDLKELVEYKDELIDNQKESIDIKKSIIDKQEEIIDYQQELIRNCKSVIEKDYEIIKQLKTFQKQKEDNENDYVQR